MQEGLFSRPAVERPTLRDYQKVAIEMLGYSLRSGHRCPVLVLPCGAGKTVVAAELMRRCVERNNRALFLAPRRELVDQTAEKLDSVGVEYGVVMAGEEHRHDPRLPLQVGSVDTLLARMVRRKRLTLQTPDLVFWDECHLGVSETRKRLMNLWPDAVRIGLTATPSRKDGKALGTLWDDICEPTTYGRMTEEGYLSPCRYFSVAEPDLKGVRVTAGDYNNRQLEERMNQTALVGDIVQHWLEHARNRRTAVFATSIAHSISLCEEFQRAGVAAEHCDAKTDRDTRRAIFGRFRSGKTEVLCNVYLASYGFDLPALSCVVLARPTRSMVLYLQTLGRALRIAPGKDDCLILDHSGAVLEHGFVTDEREWTLDGEEALTENKPAVPREPPEAQKPIKCPECGAVFKRTNRCPECGFKVQPQGKPVEVRAGSLVEIDTKRRKPKKSEAGMPEWTRRGKELFAQLAAIGRSRGYKPGWAKIKYKVALGRWPSHATMSAAEGDADPDPEVLRWVQSQQRKWAIRKGYAMRRRG